MLTIIHGADFHLDAPFAALPPDKARARRAEQRDMGRALALDCCASAAVEELCDQIADRSTASRGDVQVVVDGLARLDIGAHARKPHRTGAIRLQVNGIALDRHLVIGKIGIEHIAGPQPACYTRIALIGTIGLVIANGTADLARFKIVAKRRARRDAHHMAAGQTVLHPNVEHARRIHTAVAASLERQPHRARHI